MKKRLKILYISDKKIQKAISKPIPKKIIDCFYETPLTASQIADAVSFPKDKIYYHIKKLVSLDILYISETKEIKGIIQKKFLPISEKIVFGEAPDEIPEDLEKNTVDEKTSDEIIIKKHKDEGSIMESESDKSDKITNTAEAEVPGVSTAKTDEVPIISSVSYNRSINDRRKSRDRRNSFIRRSNMERRIKQSFDYSTPDRRTHATRRSLDDRRIHSTRRDKNDRRLEGETSTVKRSHQRILSKRSQAFISSSFLFSSLAHLQGMKKAITFVHSGDTVTCMQAQMGLDDFIIKDVKNYTLPMRIEEHVIQTLPELIRHVYYQTVDTANSGDYYLALSSSDYDYQMVYLDTENLDEDIEGFIQKTIEKSFSIRYDKTVADWTMNDTIENSAVVCYSTKIDSIQNDYSSLTNFGIQPRYNTSIPQIIYNIYQYSHYGIGGGNALIVYIENHRTNLVLIQNAQLVDSQFFTIGFGSFVNTIIHLFKNVDKYPMGSKLSATRFLYDHGATDEQTISRNAILSPAKMKTAFEDLSPILESFKSEILSSYRFFSGVRNKISGRGLVIDNVFIGGSGSHIKNMKEIVHELLNYPVHSLDDLYLGHTKKLTLPKQQKKLARNQKNLLKQQRRASRQIEKVKEKIESNEKELMVYSDLSRLEVKRDKLILDKAGTIKNLKKIEKSLLLAKMKKTKLDDHYKTDRNRLVQDLEKMSDELEAGEKDNLKRYKKADLISQYLKNSTGQDKSRLVNDQQSVADIEILIRDLQNEKEDTEKNINSLESDIDIINAKIVQQEKAIELNVKEHVYISSELEQKRKQADHFINNPWRRPKTTMGLRSVLDKENNDLSGKIKELEIGLITKKSDLDKYKGKRTELIKTISPLNTELEESEARHDEINSKFIDVRLDHEKNLNRLKVMEDEYEKTNAIYLENLSELENVINRLDEDSIVKNISKSKTDLIGLNKEEDKITRRLGSIEEQFELDIEYDKSEQKNLNKKRKLAEKSLATVQRKILSAKTKLDQNFQDIDHGKNELNILTYLDNAINTAHELIGLRFSDDLMDLNNSDRSVETALATAEKSISWSLSQLDSHREQFASQNAEMLKPKKRRSQHEKNELAFVENILSIMDTLLHMPRDLRRLKDSLHSLKLVTDSRASYQTRLNDNDTLIDDIQQKKAELIKRKSNRNRRTNRNEKIVKRNQSELKNKQLTLEQIISSSNDKTEELDSLRLLNAKENDSNDETIKSRIIEIDKIEIDIDQLYAHKKNKNELSSEKRIQEADLVNIVKDTEEQLKHIARIEETLLDSSARHSEKVDGFKNKSQDIEKNIDQLYSEISSEEEWTKKSKDRIKEIQTEKRAWQEETIILKDEEKTLSLQASKMKKETVRKKETLQNDFSANIEKIEIEQSSIIQKSNEEKEKIKQNLFVELDALQKQEEGIQDQLDKQVAKLDNLSNQSQSIKDQIKKEKDRTNSDLSDMIKQSSEHQDARDSLQSDIYRLQNELKKMTAKRDTLRSQLSDKVVNTGERVSELEERIIYKNTDDYLSFVIEGLERVGTESDQNIIAQQIIAESIEIDTNEVVYLKKSLKKFRQSAKERLSESSKGIKRIEKELEPYQRKRNILSRKIRALNKKIETLNKPLYRLERNYEKISDQKKIEEKNFLAFQNTAENELKQINQKRGQIEDNGSKEIKTIEASLDEATEKIHLRIDDNSKTYKIELHLADENLSSILEKINNRLEKIKIIISAGKKIQEENKAETASILSRRKTASQTIKKHRKSIKIKQGGLKKNESKIKIELDRYEKYRDKVLNQLKRSEEGLIVLTSKKDTQEQDLSVTNSRIAKYDEMNPNIDKDIKGLKTQIQRLKNKNKSDLKDKSSFNQKFLMKQSTIVDALESLNKKRENIESNISSVNILLLTKKDELGILYDEIKKTDNSLAELDANHKICADQKIDIIHQIDRLTKDKNRTRSVISGIILGLRKNKEVRENVIPLIANRIEGVNGFIKEYNADQKMIKDSLKQFRISQKTKAAALVSVEQEIIAIGKKIDSAEKYYKNNKSVTENELTNKKILVDRLQSEIISLEDKLESTRLQLVTLSDQKRMTQKAIKKSDKDFQKQRRSQEQLSDGIEKEMTELGNTLLVLKASVKDLKTRTEPVSIEKRKTDDIIGNLKIEIDQISVELRKLKMNYRDNQKSVKKADKIISSEHLKLKDEEKEIKSSIQELETMLENASSYNKEQRNLLERSINKKIELEDIVSDKKEKKQSLEARIDRAESLIIDKKKFQKLKNEEIEVSKEIKIAENKISHLRENFKSINEVILENERTYHRDLRPLSSKISAAELSIVDLKNVIRKSERRILELNRQIRIAPTKSKKLKSLNQKYVNLRDDHELRLKEADRGLYLIKKKIKILEKQKADKENKDYEITKDIDYIANIGLLLDPTETLNLLPDQHKKDYWFYMPNRLIQAATILFLFLSTIINVFQTSDLHIKENTIPDKIQNYSVVTSEKKVYEDLINDINILDHYKYKMNVDETNSKNIISLLKYVSNTVPKEFKVTELRVDEPKYIDSPKSSPYADASLSIYVGGFVKMNSSRSKKILNNFQDQIEMSQHFKEIQISEQSGGKKSRTVYEINLLL